MMMHFSSVLFNLLLFLMQIDAQITPSQQQEILAVFNEARATTVLPAANMIMLEWDEAIAFEMQAYTDACNNIWEIFSNPPAWFAYRDHGPTAVGIAKWRTLRMAPYFDYYTGGCINTTQSLKICRNPNNYENVVLAQNQKVGCGMSICGPGPKGIFHACAIGGTEPRIDYPWIIGPRCSKCPSGFPHCINGLCASQTSPPSEPTVSPSMHPSKIRTRRKHHPRHHLHHHYHGHQNV